MPAHTYCTLADSKHTINFAFNNLWRGDGSRSLSIFIAKGGRWEGSTWKCKASYFSSNTACYMVSKGTKQPGLPTANIRAARSDAYPYRQKQSSTVVFLKLCSVTFPSLLMTRKRLYHRLWLITAAFAKEAVMFGIRCQLCRSIPSSFFLHLYSHLSLSLPCLCLSVSLSLLNSPPALTQALLIAGSLLNSHNALL